MGNVGMKNQNCEVRKGNGGNSEDLHATNPSGFGAMTFQLILEAKNRELNL